MFIQNTLEDELTFAGFYPAIARVIHGGGGAVRFECPDLYGTDDGSGENLSDWIEVSQLSNGGLENKGDSGTHLPVPEGSLHVLGFIGRDHTQLIAMPLGKWKEEPEPNKELASKEVKGAIKKEEDHRIHQYKTPAGFGWCINDVTGKEQLIVEGPSGCLVFDGAFKGEEPKQEKDKKTKSRTAEKRGNKSVSTQTQKAPGEIFKNKAGYVRLLGQNGSGLTIIDAEDGSGMIIRCADSKNVNTGPSIVLSSKDGGSIIFSVGSGANKFQLKLRGKTGDMKSTKTIIQEDLYFPVEESIIKPVTDLLVKASKESLYTEVITA